MFVINKVMATSSKQCLATAVSMRHSMRVGLPAAQLAFFSTESEQQPAAPQAEEPTAAEVTANRDEWGIKYDDECLKFEKEWKEVAEKVQSEQMVYLSAELSDLQKKKVEMLADKVLDMNLFEHRYFHALLSERV